MQGSASGQLWNDTVSLGGHELDNQTVALCDEVSGTLLGGNASGIMGKPPLVAFSVVMMNVAYFRIMKVLAFPVFLSQEALPSG